MSKQNKAFERFEIAVVFLLFQRSSMQSCLQLSFEIPFIVRVGNVSVVSEGVKLVFYSTAHNAFAKPKVTALYECSVRCTIYRALVLFSLFFYLFLFICNLIRIK